MWRPATTPLWTTATYASVGPAGSTATASNAAPASRSKATSGSPPPRPLARPRPLVGQFADAIKPSVSARHRSRSADSSTALTPTAPPSRHPRPECDANPPDSPQRRSKTSSSRPVSLPMHSRPRYPRRLSQGEKPICSYHQPLAPKSALGPMVRDTV